MEFKRFDNKGITLIALVVTIIILLLLAGITLNFAVGEGGLIERTLEAKELNRQRALDEQLQLIFLRQSIEQDNTTKDTQITGALREMVGEKEITQEDVNQFNELIKKYNKSVISISSKEDIGKIGTNPNYPLSGIYIQLSDINYSEGENLTPIGSDSAPFTGVYDGNEKTFTGLNIKNTSNNLGIFSVNAGTIKNIKVEDFDIHLTHGAAGTIVGKNRGLIENCTILSGNIELTGVSAIGGVCGRNEDGGNIRNCVNYANVSCNYKLVGGICGYSIGGDIENCTNYGNITGPCQVGGIAGDSEGINTNNISHVSKCVNEGKITIEPNKTVYTTTYGAIGGIVGCNYKNSKIENCENNQIIESELYGVGGIVGHNVGRVELCKNKANVTCTLKGTNIDNNIGGISGYNQEGMVSKSYNTGNITGAGKAVGGIVGRITNELGGVDKCYNTGFILSDANCVGGICGVTRGSIIQCYNKGNVGNNEKVNFELGGITGATARGGIIEDCYNEGIVQGDTKVGGISGSMATESNTVPKIIRSYNNANVIKTTSTVSNEQLIGGILGVNTGGKIEGCFYNKTYGIKGISKTEDVVGSFQGKTLQELQNKATFVGWDFDKIWKIESNTPYLEFDF